MRRLLIILACLVWAAPAVAQDGGTVSPFDFGAGSRELALGGAAITNADPTSAVYWNPSRLATTEQIAFTGFYSQLFESDVVYQYAGFVFPTLDYGSFGVGIFNLGVSGIDKRDENNYSLGKFDDSRIAVHLAYGKEFGEYNMGLSVHLERHSIDSYSATSSPGVTLAVGRGFDLGSNFLRRLDLSVVGRNVVSPGMKLMEETVSYPFTGDLAASLLVAGGESLDHVATLSVRLRKTTDVDPKLAVGLEYSLGNTVHLRGGATSSNMTFGGGIVWRSISFDYALAERDLGSLHLFTLSTTWGTGVTERRHRRELAREAEFDALMSDRLRAGKNEMISELAGQGRTAMEAGDLSAAADYFDRALFMARATGADTTDLSGRLQEARGYLREAESRRQYRQFLDSAEINLDTKRWVAAQYYANLALSVNPGATQAEGLLARAVDSMTATSGQAEMFNRQAVLVDSLLSYGQTDRALAILQSMVANYPDHELTQSLLKRGKFERLKEAATGYLESDRLDRAALMTDSAQAIYPGHSWCVGMKAKIEGRRHLLATTRAEKTAPEVERAQLSEELLAEVESSYLSAREAFAAGQLAGAIQSWEKVERLAPDYKSVREYLVSAYKFRGVDFYGQGDLQGAIEIWEKAIALAPDNGEIAGYLERTKTEMAKLREYSYGGH